MVTVCTTIHHILRAPRRIVGQVFNLRRIVNPPAALVRARPGLGESPTPFCGLPPVGGGCVGEVLPRGRLANPPAALVRARPGLGESPTPFCGLPLCGAGWHPAAGWVTATTAPSDGQR